MREQIRQIKSLDIYEEKTTRPPSSTRIYTARQTDSNPQVIRRGNQQLVIHPGAPPVRRATSLHWLVVAGLASGATLAVLLVISVIGQAVGNWQADQRYGYPRRYDAQAVVGHNDSVERPSHFAFLNLHGRVVITEYPGLDPLHAKNYQGPAITGEAADKVPVEGKFSDENGDGALDIVLIIRDQHYIYLNTGKEFKQEGT